MTRYTILNQSGIASLAQSNQQSQSVLSLLR
jgi:flagellin-like hook-associated protein FlgL